MRSARIAERVLGLALPREHATAATGDLLEECAGRGRAWFWKSVAGIILRSVGSDFRDEPLRLGALAVAAVTLRELFPARIWHLGVFRLCWQSGLLPGPLAFEFLMYGTCAALAFGISCVTARLAKARELAVWLLMATLYAGTLGVRIGLWSGGTFQSHPPLEVSAVLVDGMIKLLVFTLAGLAGAVCARVIAQKHSLATV